MFEVTTAVKKMLRMKARKKVIQGATSSGKTYGIIPIIYDRCLATPLLKATIVAESIPAVKDGAVDIFQRFLIEEGRWVESRWRGNPMEYKLPNGSKIQFKSFDTFGKAKAAGKRDILFLNEANHIPKDIADALMIRSKEIWMDFNADRRFWAHDEVLNEPNSEFLKLTYLDNESIPSETLEDLLIRIEKAKDEERQGKKGYWWNWVQVYVYGEVGMLQGVVFNNWEEVASIPKEARLEGFGLDFGFTNSYTACVAIYYLDGAYYYDEVLYTRGLTNQEIAEELKTECRGMIIYADSAEPKSIRELQIAGLNVEECLKGQDSVKYGIDLMQQGKFFVTSSSYNLISELQGYVWKTNREGDALNEPIKDPAHAIDAIRYFRITDAKYSGQY